MTTPKNVRAKLEALRMLQQAGENTEPGQLYENLRQCACGCNTWVLGKWARGHSGRTEGSQQRSLKRTDEELFVLREHGERNSSVPRRYRNERVVRGTYFCDVCKLREWHDAPLTLVVDHINGNRIDDRRENLRLLCPNCNSQTDTFAGRNRE